MARADTQYSQLSTLAWGQAGRIIAYQYDDNGSLTSKTTTDTVTSDVTGNPSQKFLKKVKKIAIKDLRDTQ